MSRYFVRLSVTSIASVLTVLMLGMAGLPAPAAAGDELVCGDPIDDDNRTASDALYVLRTAVGTLQCSLFICDANGSGSVTATDALIVLKAAVGQEVPLDCPVAPTTTTTTSSSSTSSSSTTSSTTTTVAPTTTLDTTTTTLDTPTTTLETPTTTLVGPTTTLEPTTTTLEPTTTTVEPTTTTEEPTTTTLEPTTTTLAPTTTTTLPGGPASVDLLLSSAATTSGSTIGFTTTVLDSGGEAVDPQPPVEVTIAPDGTVSGPTPTVVGSTIVVDDDTIGNFTVTATVTGTGITDSQTLTVMEPTAMNTQVSEFSSMFPAAQLAFEEAAAAVQGGSQAELNSAIADMIMTLDALDLEQMALVTPLSPPTGFPPSLGEVQTAGHGQTAADTTYMLLLDQIQAAVRDIIAFQLSLTPPNVTEAQLDQLEAKVNNLAMLANNLLATNPTVYAGIAREDRINVLTGQDIPKLLETVLATSIEMAQSGTVSASPAPDSRWIAMLLSTISPRDAHASFLLDIVGAMGIQGTIMDIVNKVYGKIIEDLENMVALLVLEGLLDDYTATSLCDAQGGASASVNVPNYPGSWLEGSFFNTTAELNQVLFIGPEAPQQARNLISAFNPDEMETLDDIYEFFNGIKEAFESAGEAYQNANRRADNYNPFSGLFCDFEYPTIDFNEGFPDTLGDCSVCISPVLILQHDVSQGGWSLITENFVRE